MDTLSLLLDNMRLHGATFAETQLSAPWRAGLTTPRLASFHIIIAGGCELQVGNETQPLNAWEIVLLPSGTAHTLRDAESDHQQPGSVDLLPHVRQTGDDILRAGGGGRETRMLSGHFRFDYQLARPLIRVLPDVIHVRADNGRPAPWLEIGLQFIAAERAVRRPAHQAVINRIAEILLMECLRYHIEQLPEGSGNWLLALRDPALSAALAAMHANPEKHWDVPTLAQIACLSRSAFAQRFKDIVGETPQRYLTDHRMRLAAWQLTNSNQPIWNIAEQLGYGSDSSFAQAFRRTHDIAPSAYRRNAQLNEVASAQAS